MFVTNTVAAFDIVKWAVAQRHNELLSFWPCMSRKKGLHVFWALNAENGFFKFKAKD
jgi:hypothetical protein